MFALPLALFAGAGSGVRADDNHQGDDRDRTRGDERLVLKKQIGVGVDDTGAPLTLGAFDISFVDPKIELYILADRTNASVDMFDSSDPRFIGRIGSKCPAGNPAPHFCFQGVVLKPDGTANNALSGPDGDVIVDHKEIWAGDGDSRIKVINLATQSFVTTIDTGGKFRVDEMAYDSRDHLLAAANNADTPPFVTVFDTVGKKVVAQLIFSNKPTDVCTAPNPATYQCIHTGVDAQNGIEQPQWSPQTGLFYVSVPQVGGDASVGGASVIDPKTNEVTGTFLVKNCSPAGLALGPHHEALLGCAGLGGTPPAPTISHIIDITSTDFTHVNGAVVATVPIGGSDEVWYDPGTKHYFLAARANVVAGQVTPKLGSIDALTHKLDPSAPSSTTSHSVAADRFSHFVFLPVGKASLTTDPHNVCNTTGCIAVYKAHREHSGDDNQGDSDEHSGDNNQGDSDDQN
jgi:hypothetical protein